MRRSGFPWRQRDAIPRKHQPSTSTDHRVSQHRLGEEKGTMAPSSSPSSSSQQSSLYQYYTPIASADVSSPSPSRVLQPSSRQNIAARRSRNASKRSLHPTKSIPPSPKKAKPQTAQNAVCVTPQTIPPPRHGRMTLPRGLLIRGQQGQRGGLTHRTFTNSVANNSGVSV